MGFGAGLFLIAIGAILTWAVKNPDSGNVNVHAIGVILMLAGLAGFLVSLFFWESWAGPGYWMQRRRYAAGRVAAPAQSYWGRPGRRRATYVEEAPAPAPTAGPPPPAPPPDPPPY